MPILLALIGYSPTKMLEASLFESKKKIFEKRITINGEVLHCDSIGEQI